VSVARAPPAINCDAINRDGVDHPLDAHGIPFRVGSGDSILAVTNPPSVPVLAAVVSFLLRVPYSLVVHDVYPDIIAACGMRHDLARIGFL
jgi:hypothetical protein